MSGPDISEPGVYDLAADVYHRDPVVGGSLSSTGARKLLPPSCPALYRHWADNPQRHKRVFDFGQAAHAAVLGVGRPLAVIDAEDWRTKAAREARGEAYAAGEVPLLTAEHEQVRAMAAALREHPIAAALFDPDTGRGEQSLIWRDELFGVWRRAMLDWLPDHHDGRLVLPEYKSCHSADPAELSRVVHNYGYAIQGAWYLDAVRALGLAGDLDPAFVFVFQEKTPPYLVAVAQLDPAAVLWGGRLGRKALDVYRCCSDTGRWPGYTDGVISLGLPAYATRQLEDAWEMGDLNPTTHREAAA